MALPVVYADGLPRWSRDERTCTAADDCKARRRRRWSARCKNALQLLNELRPGLEYRVVSQTGPCHRPVFTVHLQLAGQVLVRVHFVSEKKSLDFWSRRQLMQTDFQPFSLTSSQ